MLEIIWTTVKQKLVHLQSLQCLAVIPFHNRTATTTATPVKSALTPGLITTLMLYHISYPTQTGAWLVFVAASGRPMPKGDQVNLQI